MSVSLYPFSSWIGMWNCLVTLPINDREGMDKGGEGTSANSDNGGRDLFSVAAMAIDGGVVVGL